MAIAGNACSAYRLQVRDGELCVLNSTTVQRSLCAGVEDALIGLARGEVALVAGADVAEVRRRVGIALGKG
jgi:hypothetical protein